MKIIRYRYGNRGCGYFPHSQAMWSEPQRLEGEMAAAAHPFTVVFFLLDGVATVCRPISQNNFRAEYNNEKPGANGSAATPPRCVS